MSYEDQVRRREADRILFELVELKRLNDSVGENMSATEAGDYERRQLIAWRKAFRLFNVFEEPK